MRHASLAALAVLLAALSAAGCGGSDGGDDFAGPGDGTRDAGGGDADDGGAGGEGGSEGGPIFDAGPGNDDASDAQDEANPCALVQCPADQHCAPGDAGGACVSNTCADLQCTATEVCAQTPGGGAICKSIACAADVECPASQFCDGTICVDDVCAPGTSTCHGQEVWTCPANGSGEVLKYTCGSAAYFTSTCVDDGMGHASCPCEDDWDCPANTVCEGATCTGTGKAPTCTLPPVPFQSVLPVLELQWGGMGQGSPKNLAVNAPFPSSSQVSMTPLVVNLDDDNGDGRIDERDFPEIVFMSYCGTAVTTDGVVRAIHGGGPNKGKDFFASAGANVWHEGDPLSQAFACSNAIGNSTGSLAAGDLDGDGAPEIVVPTENAALAILDHLGRLVATGPTSAWTSYPVPAVAIANLDAQGLPELVIGRDVFTLGLDASQKLVFVDHFAGNIESGKNGQGPISCVANVAGGPELEVIGGSTVYRLPKPPAGVAKRADCAAGDTSNFCLGKLDVVWDGQTVNGAAAVPNAQRDGFCAVADILGADPAAAPGPTNPLDGAPEVILVSNGYLVVYEGETGILRRFVNLGVGSNGGAPNVDDFDGDGFPEVGSAFGARYVVMDLQEASASCPAWTTQLSDSGSGTQGNPARTPGGSCATDADCAQGAVCNPITSACTCLQNGWMRVTEDDSSQVTASSVFDFNGDGAAEVVYNDECYFRIYDGTTGDVLFKNHTPSRTRTENPVIADVDNDGNAEIVFCSNNDANTCSAGNDYPNGIAVWGDASDTWVPARRVWNEHAYHVTNVLEGGGIPAHEPESWKTYAGRRYDAYRSNPRSYGVAPDLVTTGVQMSSPDAMCGQLSKKLTITAEIANAGDVRVGPGVVVGFYGVWTSPALDAPLHAPGGVPLTYTLQASLEPGDAVLVTVAYDSADDPPGVLPDSVRVVVDEAQANRECVESNNALEAKVDPGQPRADLRVELGAIDGATCPSPTLPTTVWNDGSAPASNVLVRFYAGDPGQGGQPFHDETFAGPIAPGASATTNVTLSGFPQALNVLVWAVVDPANAIAECNDGNNAAAASDKVMCGGIH